MLGPQRISESLETLLLINGTHPSSRLIRTWHHHLPGSNIVPFTSLFVALTSFGFSFYYEHELKQFVTNMLFCSVMAVFLESINLWASRRDRIEALSKSLILVARAIEEQCSQKQLAKMEKVTCWTRIFVAIYAYDIALVIVLYKVFPFYQGKLFADIPGLVDNPVFYWIFWALEAIVLSAGSIT